MWILHRYIRLKPLFKKMASKRFSLKKLTVLLMKITPDRVQLTAAGIVTVGKHLIPTVSWLTKTLSEST